MKQCISTGQGRRRKRRGRETEQQGTRELYEEDQDQEEPIEEHIEEEDEEEMEEELEVEIKEEEEDASRLFTTESEEAGGETYTTEVPEPEQLVESGMQAATHEEEEVVNVVEVFEDDANADKAQKARDEQEELGYTDTDNESLTGDYGSDYESEIERKRERRARRKRMRQLRQEEHDKQRTIHLPPSLETLSISSSKCIIFPSLPSTLQEITLGSDGITIIDKKLPSSLRVIQFSGIASLSFFVLFFFLVTNTCRRGKPV